jgi:serine/threonine protein kinase
LDELIKRLSEPMPIPRANEIFKKVLSAFAYAHKNGIIHRDVKPSNILITSNDEVKVLDFGIAKLVEGNESHLTKTGAHLGTVYYMSPEQVRAENLDQRSDIYSLGITFYEMLAGFCPYASVASEYEIYNSIVKESLTPLTKTLGGDYYSSWQIILKATQKNKNNRFKNCEEIIEAIDDLNRKESHFQKEEIKEKINVDVNNSSKNLLIWVFLGIIAISSTSFFIWKNYISGSNETSETNIGEKVCVIREELPFRDTTNLESAILFNVPFGAEIELLQEKCGPFKEDEFLRIWQKARYNGSEGWIVIEIDSQKTIGTKDQVDQLTALWGGKYNKDSEYALLRKWAHYEIRDFLKSRGWTNKYKFKYLSQNIRNRGYRTILKYHINQDYVQEDRYDYVILLESITGGNNIALFCKADTDGQGGQILGWCQLPGGSSYFSYTKNESVYGDDFQIGEIIIHNNYNGITGYLDDANYSVYQTSKFSDYSHYGC